MAFVPLLVELVELVEVAEGVTATATTFAGADAAATATVIASQPSALSVAGTVAAVGATGAVGGVLLGGGASNGAAPAVPRPTKRAKIASEPKSEQPSVQGPFAVNPNDRVDPVTIGQGPNEWWERANGFPRQTDLYLPNPRGRRHTRYWRRVGSTRRPGQVDRRYSRLNDNRIWT